MPFGVLLLGVLRFFALDCILATKTGIDLFLLGFGVRHEKT